MAKGNKNTHLLYIIEFNAIIPVKKEDQFNQIVTMKKNLHWHHFFLWWNATNLFTSINYRNVLVIWLLYCLTGIECYWYIHFNFLMKNSTVHCFKSRIYFQRMGIVLIFYIQSFTVTEYLNVKEDTGFFPRKAWESWSRYSKRCQVNTPFNCN